MSSNDSREAPPPSLSGLEVAGLFAGIGGLELGLSRAGATTVALCEIDPGARAVLSRHFPDAPIHEDVRTFRIPEKVGVVAAGFPCTDLSQAGRTAGITGPASGLIAGVLDGIAAMRRPQRPRWLVIENVPFLLQLDRGAGVRYLTERISELGYRWAYRVVDTRSFGIPQRRRRVLFVAGLEGDPRSVLFADEAADELVHPNMDIPPVGFYWTEGNTGIGWAPQAVPTLKGGSGLSIPSPPAIWLSKAIVTPHVRDAERLQGFPVDWTHPAAEVTGTDRPRWKLIGNAVSVPVAEWLGQRLNEPGDVVTAEVGRWEGRRWPDAAWGEARSGGSTVHAMAASDRPRAQACPGIAEFLKEPPSDLSRRATTGFLRRLSRSRLRQGRLTPFLQALRDHALSQGAKPADLPPSALFL